jgi:Alcohol dehydrogenase transcription factor Myb/SANT-like.
MAGKKVWMKDETMELVSLYESFPEIWDSQHLHYKNRKKRSMCWQSMGEALNASTTEVQRKMRNLCSQVSNYFPYCSARIVFFV